MPRKPVKKMRPPERDYSHRALLDKLGVKAGQRVCVLAIKDAEFAKDLAGVIPDVTQREQEESDLIFMAAEDLKALSRMKPLSASIKSNGAIWVIYPKGQRHIREVDVIAAGKAAGLVDNKVCRFSETHTGLRFVIPLARR